MNQTNSEMPISSFTLNELITMAGGEKRPGIMGECIAANSASEMEIFRFPSRLNALIIGVGTEGETSLTSNLQEFRLKKDSLFIFSPKHILQVQSNNRFKAHLIVIAPDFLKRINIDTKRMMPLFLQFGSLPCMELTHAESQSLRSFISMVEQELKGSETDFSSEIIGGLIAATMAAGATTIALTSHGGVTALVIGGLFQGAYEERELAPVNLSRSLEDSVTITEPLMPWTVSAVFMAGTLGVSTIEYAPWALFCYGGPFFSLLIAALYERTGFGIRRLEQVSGS